MVTTGSDNTSWPTYRGAMERGQPYIKLRLDTKQPIELGDFVSAFTSLATEYDRYMRAQHPEAASGASLYVSEIRKGSIEALLIPAVIAPMLPDIVNTMSQILTIEDFLARYSKRLGWFTEKSALPEDVTKAELRDFSSQVAAIANNPGSTIEFAAIQIENGEHKVSAAFKFDTNQARAIEDNVQTAKIALEHKDRADYLRALMVFTRSDVTTVPMGKSTGERVRIDSISDRSLPLIYASDMAEQSIKHEIREAEDNVFKKGFIVDVNVESRGGRAIAYRVTNLHQVIDLDD